MQTQGALIKMPLKVLNLNRSLADLFNFNINKESNMIVYKINLDGTLSHKEYMNNWDEVNTWLADKLGKFANVKVVSEKNSDDEMYFTDDGFGWVEIGKYHTKNKEKMDFDTAYDIIKEYGGGDALEGFSKFMELDLSDDLEMKERVLNLEYKKFKKAFLTVKEGMSKLLAPK